MRGRLGTVASPKGPYQTSLILVLSYPNSTYLLVSRRLAAWPKQQASDCNGYTCTLGTHCRGKFA